MSQSRFGYDNKRVLVLGGATGMGAAAAKVAAELGAETIVMDIAPIDYACAQSIEVDLSDRASVDAAAAQITGPIHAVFSCAGIAEGPPLMRINFISQRHLLENLLTTGKLGRGGAIAMISSAAGMGWETQLDEMLEFLAQGDWASADAWIESHPGTNNYIFSKRAMRYAFLTICLWGIVVPLRRTRWSRATSTKRTAWRR